MAKLIGLLRFWRVAMISLIVLLLAPVHAAAEADVSELFNRCSVRGGPGATTKVRDFDGDGKSDILWYNLETGDQYEMLMDGLTMKAGAFVAVEPKSGWIPLGSSDSNADGKEDRLWRNSSGEIRTRLVRSSEAESLTLLEPWSGYQPWFNRDFNGDGCTDLLLGDRSSEGLFLHLKNAIGGTVGVVPVDFELNATWQLHLAADFDGDGKSELVFLHPQTRQLYMLFPDVTADINAETLMRLVASRTALSHGQVFYAEPNASWQIERAADFNGDGRADILWRNSVTGMVYVMFMNGTTVIGGDTVYTEPNTAWQIVGTGDYNGDGRADILWRNYDSGDVFMMLMNGTTILSSGFIYSEPNLDWMIMPF